MAEQMTRDEYNRKRRHDYAGTASTLLPSTVEAWRKCSPDWDGKHWAMGMNERGGTTLGPVNVR